MKSYTDIEQSKQLAEFLPIESADMCYQKVHAKQEYFNIAINVPPENQNDLPCWSLAGLISVLPYYPDLSKHTDEKWYITTYPNDINTCLMAFNNPVDACYEMILKLHELKML